MSLSVRGIIDGEYQKAWRRADCARELLIRAVRDPSGFYLMVTQQINPKAK
jgi:hypothetical protein